MALSGPAHDLRISFFITSYRPAEQLCRLVSTLRKAEPDSPIVIHHDSFQSPLDPSLFADVPHVHVLTSASPIVWGDMSLEAARWRTYRWILENVDVDWVMLLSEQDYPIEPLRELRLRLGDSGVDAFISGQRVDQIKDEEARRVWERRYLYQYWSLPSSKITRQLAEHWTRSTSSYGRRLYAGVDRSGRTLSISLTPAASQQPIRIGVRARKTPFSADFPCWAHNSWCALSRKALEHIVDYLDSNPGFARYYERTVIPVESATGTIVFNDPQLKVANVNLHAIRWTNRGSGRPDVFGRADLEFLCSSSAVFARKFDQASADLLDELDKIVFRNCREVL